MAIKRHMTAKPKHTRASSPNRTAAIDPRLARVHALLDTFHPHTASEGLAEQFPAVFRRLLDCFCNPGLVDVSVFKKLITDLTKPSKLIGEQGVGSVNQAKSEILDAMVQVADDEHRSVCACCRRAGSHEASIPDDDPSMAELRGLVIELQDGDPKALRALLVKARALVGTRS